MGCYEEPKTFKGQTKLHIAIMLCNIVGIPECLTSILSLGFINPHWRLTIAKWLVRIDWL